MLFKFLYVIHFWLCEHILSRITTNGSIFRYDMISDFLDETTDAEQVKIL